MIMVQGAWIGWFNDLLYRHSCMLGIDIVYSKVFNIVVIVRQIPKFTWPRVRWWIAVATK